MFADVFGAPGSDISRQPPIDEVVASIDDIWQEFLPPDIIDLLQEGQPSMSLPQEVIHHPDLEQCFRDMRAIICSSNRNCVATCLEAGVMKHVRILYGFGIAALPTVLLEQSVWILINILSGSTTTKLEAIQQGAFDMLVMILDSPDTPTPAIEQAIWCAAKTLGDGPDVCFKCMERCPAFFTSKLGALLDDLLANHAEKVTVSLHSQLITHVVMCMSKVCGIKPDFTRGDVTTTHIDAMEQCLGTILAHADFLISREPESLQNSPLMRGKSSSKNDQQHIQVEALYILSSIAEATTELTDDPQLKMAKDRMLSLFMKDTFAAMMKSLFYRFDQDAKKDHLAPPPQTDFFSFDQDPGGKTQLQGKMILPLARILGSLATVGCDKLTTSMIQYEMIPWLLTYTVEAKPNHINIRTLFPPVALGELARVISHYIPLIQHQTPDLDQFVQLRYLEITAFCLHTNVMYHQAAPLQQLMGVLSRILTHPNKPLFAPIVLSPLFLELIYGILCYPIPASHVPLVREIITHYRAALQAYWRDSIDENHAEDTRVNNNTLSTTLQQVIMMFINIDQQFDLHAFFQSTEENKQEYYQLAPRNQGASQHEAAPRDQGMSQHEACSDGKGTTGTTPLTTPADNLTISFNLPYTILDHSILPSPGTTYAVDLLIKRFATMNMSWEEYVNLLG